MKIRKQSFKGRSVAGVSTRRFSDTSSRLTPLAKLRPEHQVSRFDAAVETRSDESALLPNESLIMMANDMTLVPESTVIPHRRDDRHGINFVNREQRDVSVEHVGRDVLHRAKQEQEMDPEYIWRKRGGKNAGLTLVIGEREDSGTHARVPDFTNPPTGIPFNEFNQFGNALIGDVRFNIPGEPVDGTAQYHGYWSFIIPFGKNESVTGCILQLTTSPIIDDPSFPPLRQVFAEKSISSVQPVFPDPIPWIGNLTAGGIAGPFESTPFVPETAYTWDVLIPFIEWQDQPGLLPEARINFAMYGESAVFPDPLDPNNPTRVGFDGKISPQTPGRINANPRLIFTFK